MDSSLFLYHQYIPINSRGEFISLKSLNNYARDERANERKERDDEDGKRESETREEREIARARPEQEGRRRTS